MTFLLEGDIKPKLDTNYFSTTVLYCRCDCESLPPTCQGGRVKDYRMKTSRGQVLDSVETAYSMSGQVLTFSQDEGVTCWNKEQSGRECKDWMFMDEFQGGPPCCDDYSVQYCCTPSAVENTIPMVRRDTQNDYNLLSQEMVTVQILVNKEYVLQKVFLYSDLKILLLVVPAHDGREGVTVLMDQLQVRTVKLYDSDIII